METDTHCFNSHALLTHREISGLILRCCSSVATGNLECKTSRSNRDKSKSSPLEVSIANRVLIVWLQPRYTNHNQSTKNKFVFVAHNALHSISCFCVPTPQHFVVKSFGNDKSHYSMHSFLPIGFQKLNSPCDAMVLDPLRISCLGVENWSSPQKVQLYGCAVRLC